MPVNTFIFPIIKPFEFFTWTNKKLHFHLFKLSHSENKFSCNNLISKCFTNLSNSKWNFHTACFININEVYKDTLSGFWAQIYCISTFSYRAHLSREHQIKLTNICPIF